MALERGTEKRDAVSPADAVLEAGPRFSPLWWLVLAAAMLACDYLTGPFIQFPILYTVPIGLAAWFHGLRWALPLAVVMPLARLWYAPLWGVPDTLHYPVVNAVARASVFVTIAILASRAAERTRELGREVEILEAMLPICSHCKRIRNDEDEWERLEAYFSARSATRFSHGICPECMRRHYAEYADD